MPTAPPKSVVAALQTIINHELSQARKSNCRPQKTAEQVLATNSGKGLQVSICKPLSRFAAEKRTKSFFALKVGT
jgi:hypothetical protein